MNKNRIAKRSEDEELSGLHKVLLPVGMVFIGLLAAAFINAPVSRHSAAPSVSGRAAYDTLNLSWAGVQSASLR